MDIACRADIIGVSVRSGLGVLAMGTVDALLGIVVGLLLLRILFAAQARHHRLIRNLEIIAEMNHHIRNALVAFNSPPI